MGRAVRALARRRRVATAAFLIATAASVVVYLMFEVSLRNTSIGTGLLLLLLVASLVALNVRKKMPLFPFFTSATWLQIHIYVGLFAVVCFGMHVGFRVPNGGLEVTLSLLFWTVALSGVVGLFLTRTIPKRLRMRGEPILFERHPIVLRRLRHGVAVRATETLDSPSIAEFYARRLVDFFAKPRSFWWHLLESNRLQVALLGELEALGRYLNDEEDAVRVEIADLIKTKSDLDYHYAHQAMLKYWLFVHIPLSYSLLIVGVLHGLVAFAWGDAG